MTRRRWLVFGTLVLATVWAVLQNTQAWGLTQARANGADFSSYYWAYQAALDGLDPYSSDALTDTIRASGSRAGVHPFFYPPPFLLAMSWVGERTVGEAYRIWFWVDVAAAGLCAAVLALWWRSISPMWSWLAVLSFLCVGAVANNHAMGQVNLAVLAVVLIALWADDEEAPVAAGILMGMACMAKMSPAFFVAWWLVRRRWTSAAVSCITAIVLSGLALLLVPLDIQWRFYSEVLPGFGTGDYNGLRVPIGMWGNHSIPQWFHSLWPGAGRQLSETARHMSSAFMLGTLVTMGVAFYRPKADLVARAGQIGAVSIAILLVPVYTYEHHLVYAIPGMVAVIGGTLHGRLPRWSLGLWLVAAGVVCVELGTLQEIARHTPALVHLVLREAKPASLLVLFVGAVALGRSQATVRR
ncbi:MAG: hypothetical protein ACJATT_002849 [Myxococcota bacterium]|jgi:hypothetical protein